MSTYETIIAILSVTKLIIKAIESHEENKKRTSALEK